MKDSGIIWRRRIDFDFDDYSLNIRILLLAGEQSQADGMTAECRKKFGKEPDLTPQPDDHIYFREAYGRSLPRRKP